MKILILSIFSIECPRHGGQIRLSNIAKLLKLNAHDVCCCGVLSSSGYEKSKYFLDYPKKEIEALYEKYKYPYATDFYTGKAVEENDKLFKSLVEKIPFVPDLIFVEMPWLFGVAYKYRHLYAKNAKLVLGTENIEHRLKSSIIEDDIQSICKTEFINTVENLERIAIQNSDAVLGVSLEDLEWIKKYKKDNVFYVPNGVSDREVLPSGELEFKKLNIPSKFVLFCGSAHQPNVTGLYKIFKSGLGCIKPNEKLVIVGSVCDAIKADVRFRNIPNFDRSTMLLGCISDELLISILKRVHCTILPILEGGGTNLKTAEAIWFSPYVVGTKTSFRGFSKFIDSRYIFEAKDPIEFKNLIRLCLDEKCLTRKRTDQVTDVLWENCLKNFLTYVNSIN